MINDRLGNVIADNFYGTSDGKCNHIPAQLLLMFGDQARHISHQPDDHQSERRPERPSRKQVEQCHFDAGRCHDGAVRAPSESKKETSLARVMTRRCREAFDIFIFPKAHRVQRHAAAIGRRILTNAVNTYVKAMNKAVTLRK